MKKFLTVLAVLALLVLVAKPVAAVEDESTAVAVDFNGALFLDSNQGMVMNDVSSFANSGFNNSGEEATLTTNGASAETISTSELNSNVLSGSIDDTNSDVLAYNNDVDDEALAIAIDANLVGVINFNEGLIGNKAIALANTGFNYADEESTILTGNAWAKTDTDSNLNYNDTDVTINASGEGPVAYNYDLDDDGTAVAVDANVVLVANLNMGGVCNFDVAGANSGMNYAGEESSLVTTQATADTKTNTDLNTNDTTVVIDKTKEDGSVAANVDFDGDGVAVAVDVNAAVVFNGNFGVVHNVSLAGANTGANFGGEESSITTGAAVAGTSTTTALNTNTTSVTITDNSNGPVAVNTDDACEFDPCNPQVPSPCDESPCDGDPCEEEDGCECECGGTDSCGGTQSGSGPVAANIDTENGVSVAVDANVAVVANDNQGVVVNTSVALANSGANGSGEEGTVSTGTATANTGTTSSVNTNDTTVSITDGASSGPVAVNEDTCDGTAVAVDANVVVVSNDNSALVVNNSTAVSNTGANGEAPQNACSEGCDDEGGSVTTGDATSSTTATNTVNTNTTTFTINH